LRRYFQNRAAPAANKGESAMSANGMVRRWQSEMRKPPADVVCVNDAASDALDNSANPRYPVSVARAAGKTVIPDTPHSVLQGSGGMKPEDGERVKSFASAMRPVAREMDVPYETAPSARVAWAHRTARGAASLDWKRKAGFGFRKSLYAGQSAERRRLVFRRQSSRLVRPCFETAR
jgi:hypothetical protein